MTQPTCQVRILTPDPRRFEHLRGLLEQAEPGLLRSDCRQLRAPSEIARGDGNVFLTDHAPAAGRDGLRLIRRLRAEGFRQAVILLLPPGSVGETVTFEEAKLAGAADCLPDERVDAFSLPRAVRSACAQAEADAYDPPDNEPTHSCEKARLLEYITDHLGSMGGRMDATGTVVSLTGPLYHMLFAGQGEPVGRSIFQMFPDAGAFLRRALAGENTVFVSVVRQGGRERRIYTFLFFDEAHSRSVVFLTRDITDQDEHITRALAESRHQFQMLLEHSLDAILLLDDSGLCIEANRAAGELVGCPPEKLVGHYADELGFRDGALARLHANTASRQGGISLTRPDGQVRLLEYAAYRAAPQFYLCILRDRTEQRRLEREILEVSDLEQERFSQDLHDGLGQHLAGVGYMTEALAARLQARAATEACQAREIGELIGQAIVQTREIARGVCPPDLTAGQLPDVLARLAASFRTIYGTACSFEQTGDDALPALPRQKLLHLYRIAQEAANNAHRHGQPDAVAIRLDCHGGEVTLSVCDDGRGIAQPSAEAAADKGDRHGGLGLRMMNYRATLLGGTLSVQPGPEGAGTVVACVLDAALCHDGPSVGAG